MNAQRVLLVAHSLCIQKIASRGNVQQRRRIRINTSSPEFDSGFELLIWIRSQTPSDFVYFDESYNFNDLEGFEK